MSIFNVTVSNIYPILIYEADILTLYRYISVKSEAFFFIFGLELGTANLGNRDLFLKFLTEVGLSTIYHTG